MADHDHDPDHNDIRSNSFVRFADGFARGIEARAAIRREAKLLGQGQAQALAQSQAGPTAVVSDDPAWQQRRGGIRRREFYNKRNPLPIGIMEVNQYNGIGIEIVADHLDEDGIRALESFLAQLLRYTV